MSPSIMRIEKGNQGIEGAVKRGVLLLQRLITKKKRERERNGIWG
jgi:hypothetical protein